jgi:hypothetical protein
VQAFQSSGGNLNYATSTDIATTFSVQRISGPSAIAATETISFEIQRNATATSLYGSGTTVKKTFDIAPQVDTHGGWSAANNWYVIPASGLYEIDAKEYLSSVAAETLAIARIVIDNLTEVVQDINPKFSSANVNQVVTAGPTTQRLRAGQTVHFALSQTSGSTLNSLGNTTLNSNRFRIKRIGL